MSTMTPTAPPRPERAMLPEAQLDQFVAFINHHLRIALAATLG